MISFKHFGIAAILPILISCGGGGGGSTPAAPAPSGSTPTTSPAATCGACSTPIRLDGTVTQITGADLTQASGGVLVVSDPSSELSGTSVTIPAGSLPDDRTITVSSVSNSGLVPANVLVTEIGPSGTQLDPTQPASIMIKYDPQYLIDNNITIADLSTLKVVSFDDDVAAETLAQLDIDTTNFLVTAETTHFSYFAVLGYSNASLKGYYRVVGYNYNRNDSPQLAPAVGAALPSPKGFESDQLTVNFDGNGKWTSYDESQNDDGVVTKVPAGNLPSGSYAVLPDGTFTLTVTTNGSGAYTGQVLAGGSNFVLAQLTPGDDPGIVVGIQRIDRSYSNASLDGDYSCVGLYADSSAAQGPAPAVGSPLPALKGFSSNSQCSVTFDGLGNYTGTTTDSHDGGLYFNQNFSGTYSVAGDGTVSFTPTGESVAEIDGQLLAGGSSLIASATGGNDPEVELFIQQQPGAYSLASLKGKYTVVDYGYDHTTLQEPMPSPGAILPAPNGFQSTVVIMDFDGLGNFTASGTVNEDGMIGPISNGTTGNYAINGDGSVDLTSAGLKLSGQMLRNGSMFILGTNAVGEMSQIAVGLIR